MHLVEELASGGELFDRIIELGLFCEKDAVHLIHQVFDGIQYLHTHGMIHRDLKPENILMVGREPGTEEYMMLKICDFGLSHDLKNKARCRPNLLTLISGGRGSGDGGMRPRRHLAVTT